MGRVFVVTARAEAFMDTMMRNRRCRPVLTPEGSGVLAGGGRQDASMKTRAPDDTWTPELADQVADTEICAARRKRERQL